MRLRTVLWGGLGIFVLFLALGAGWLLSLPPTPEAIAAPAIGRQEADATIAALGPKRQRPLVAIIGINDATETTDYLMPYGILKRADVADVMTVATQPGPMTLFPALSVEPDATVAAFDARHPQGADYVIVPAMSRDDDPAVLEWIRRQSAKGAIVIGICAGAKVVGASGLLDGKRATTHWYSVGGLRDRHPSIRYVADRRFVVDQGVATTTGITASMPMMLTLIEAIAGRQKAEAVATELGLTGWDARHASAAFKFTRPFALTAIRSTLAFWDHEQMGLELTPGMDEVSLALVADAWSRTYRSRAVTVSGTNEAITSRNGIRFLPDQVAASWPSERRIASFEHQPPVEALDQTLRNIADRYGTGTKDFVAMQLEYPKQGASQ
ncbi:MAG: transcriptional regulator [Mesorhizobium sp.]|nr:MAG: transcriptional regulator [Mesorhizobium sp.]